MLLVALIDSKLEVVVVEVTLRMECLIRYDDELDIVLIFVNNY